MIVVRRAFTVPLAIVLTLLLVATLLADRANATVLSAGFYAEQLVAVGAVDALHDEVFPSLLSDFLADQDEKIPENLEGITLPTDPASQAAILELARTALPPEYLEALSTDSINATLAYLTGETDDLDLSVSLNEPLRAAFLTNDETPSEFERAWSSLDLSNTAFDGLARGIEIPELESPRNPQSQLVLARLRAEGMPLETAVALVIAVYETAPINPEVGVLTTTALGGNATIEDLEDLKTLLVVTRFIPPEPALQLVDAVGKGSSPDDDLLTIALGPGRDEAIQWFEAELFGGVRELSSYLAGDSEHFAIHVGFEGYPQLTAVLAGALNSDPRTLLRDGFRLTDTDIQRELNAGDDPPITSLEEVRAIFTPAGRTFGLDDFPIGSGEPATAAIEATAASEGPNLDSIRPLTTAISNWAVPAGAAIILVLTALIGGLGGRRWWSRAVWGAASLAIPALLIAVAAGPGYALAAAPALERAIDDRQAELLLEDSPTTPLALRALDQAELVIDGQASALATTSLAVAVLALFVAAAAIGWHITAGRRLPTVDIEASAPDRLPAPPLGDPEEPVDPEADEVRAA